MNKKILAIAVMGAIAASSSEASWHIEDDHSSQLFPHQTLAYRPAEQVNTWHWHVPFKEGSYRMSIEGRQAMRELIPEFKEAERIIIQGRPDPSDFDNSDLAQRRARSMKLWLHAVGFKHKPIDIQIVRTTQYTDNPNMFACTIMTDKSTARKLDPDTKIQLVKSTQQQQTKPYQQNNRYSRIMNLVSKGFISAEEASLILGQPAQPMPYQPVQPQQFAQGSFFPQQTTQVAPYQPAQPAPYQPIQPQQYAPMQPMAQSMQPMPEPRQYSPAYTPPVKQNNRSYNNHIEDHDYFDNLYQDEHINNQSNMQNRYQPQYASYQTNGYNQNGYTTQNPNQSQAQAYLPIYQQQAQTYQQNYQQPIQQPYRQASYLENQICNHQNCPPKYAYTQPSQVMPQYYPMTQYAPSWQMTSHKTLKQNISDWGASQGWQVDWRARDYHAENTVLSGKWPQVLRAVADATALNICASSRTRTIKVRNAGETCH